jgi:predicted AlkP superfamily phosphohydrolase/phosphomutase
MTAPGGRRRVLLIGLDAGDAGLIARWADEGFLPNVARMREEGIWVPLQTTAEQLHVSAWPSIFTGAAPDQHGLYHAYVMRPGQQAPVRPRPEDSPVPFFWRQLSDHGRHSIVMDAFMTCPLQDFSGSQIVEWGTWSWFTEPAILPPELRRQLQEKFGAYPAEDHSRIGMVPLPDPLGFHRRLLAAVAKKTEVISWLMAEQEWDLCLAVFGEPHGAGHYFWHYDDASYPAHAEADVGSLRFALREVYAAVDTAIGRLRREAGADTTVIVISGDGMGPNYSGSHILPDLLQRMGLFARQQAGAGAAPGTARAPKGDQLSRLRNLIPREVRFAISQRLFPRWLNERLSLHWKVAGISWATTRAFLIENANEGYVRINLEGREPQGVVAPGADYRAVLEQIRRTAAALICPTTGLRAAAAVHLTDELYDGPCRAQLPDLIIAWNPDAKVTHELLTEEHGVIRHPQTCWQVPPFYTGNHRPAAFALAAGPAVRPGHLPADAGVLDIAPTLLDHLGVPRPPHMSGRVLPELCGVEPVRAQP